MVFAAGMQNPVSSARDPEAKNEIPVEIVLAIVNDLKRGIHVARDPAIGQEPRP